jgi:hypothetical protein
VITAADTEAVSDGGAYTTEYITLQSGDTSDYGAAYTTMYFDVTAAVTTGFSEPSYSHHKHHQ